jgi:hypothetical protein
MHRTDQSWARHPHREPLATLQLGADKPRFFSGAANYAITFQAAPNYFSDSF